MQFRLLVFSTRSVGMILAVAFKPRFARDERLVALATNEIKRRYATRAINWVSPALKGRAKFRATLRVENHQ